MERKITPYVLSSGTQHEPAVPSPPLTWKCVANQEHLNVTFVLACLYPMWLLVFDLLRVVTHLSVRCALRVLSHLFNAALSCCVTVHLCNLANPASS